MIYRDYFPPYDATFGNLPYLRGVLLGRMKQNLPEFIPARQLQEDKIDKSVP